MWGGVSALAVATGPSLGSVLIDAGGWRWAFFVNLPVALVAGIAARRVVPESVVGGPVPDLVGVALLSAAVAALALAITQGGDWGWSSARVVGSFAAAAVLTPIAIRRSTRHEAPAIDLDVFRSRTVVLANAATFLYSVGFFGMLLANVLFLTSVWEYSTLQAGLAITPGPLLVAALSGPSGRLAARVGYGPVLVAGGLTFATGLLFYVTTVDAEASYLTHWLPGALLVGVGVALSFPVLSAAAVAGLPQERFGTGGAINQTARQIGAVLGVALLIAIVGTPTSVDQAIGPLPHRVAGRRWRRPRLSRHLVVPPPTRRDHRRCPGRARAGRGGMSFSDDTAVTRVGPGSFTAELARAVVIARRHPRRLHRRHRRQRHDRRGRRPVTCPSQLRHAVRRRPSPRASGHRGDRRAHRQVDDHHQRTPAPGGTGAAGRPRRELDAPARPRLRRLRPPPRRRSRRHPAVRVLRRRWALPERRRAARPRRCPVRRRGRGVGSGMAAATCRANRSTRPGWSRCATCSRLRCSAARPARSRRRRSSTSCTWPPVSLPYRPASYVYLSCRSPLSNEGFAVEDATMWAPDGRVLAVARQTRLAGA